MFGWKPKISDDEQEEAVRIRELRGKIENLQRYNEELWTIQRRQRKRMLESLVGKYFTRIEEGENTRTQFYKATHIKEEDIRGIIITFWGDEVRIDFDYEIFEFPKYFTEISRSEFFAGCSKIQTLIAEYDERSQK